MDRRQSNRRTWRTRNKLKQAAAKISFASNALEVLEARQLLAADVIINEIMFHPSSGDDGQEYIELLNKGDATASLTNWKFDQGVDFTFSGGTLDPGQILVVAADLAKFNAKYPGVSNVVGGWIGTLSNGGEEIRLIDNLGATVDQVKYADDGDWAVRERGRGVQLVESITNAADVATVHLFDHGFVGGDTIQIFGADQPEYNGVFPVTAITNSGENVRNTRFQYTMASAPSGPATGTIYVRRLIDHNHSGWSWVSYADGLGKSLELINSTLSNNDGQNWAASNTLEGTPGAVNSVIDSTTAPLITEVRQTPIIPKATDNVVITAQIKDEVPASISASIFWRKDALVPGAFSSVAMNDSGINGDALAGDGIWSGTIPAQTNNSVVEYYIRASDGSGNVRTYPAPATINPLISLDRAGNVVTGTTAMPHGLRPGDTITISGASAGFNGTFVITDISPTPTTALGNVATTFTFNQVGANATAANPGNLTGQSANRLYQVDNNAYTGAQMYFKLTMTEAERAELNNISNGGGGNDHQSNGTMNGTFIAQGPDGLEARYTIGIRSRGGGSRISANTPNYHIALQDDHTWGGVSALNFNGEYSMEDVIGSAIFRAAGIPAQKATPVQVRVNNANRATAGADTFGSYSWLESEDSDMVADLFPLDKDGNHYHATDDDGSPANLSYVDNNPGSYLRAYHLQTNTDNPTYADLINLVKAFNTTQTPDPAFVAAINANLHVDEWMRYFAAGVLLGDQETTLSSGFADDYSLYAGATDPRFYVQPHDIDTLLGRGDSSAQPYRGAFQAASNTLPAVQRLFRFPAFAPMYAAALQELSDTVFKAENIDALIDNTLSSYVPQATLDGMKTFVASRITSIFNPAGANPPVPLSLRVNTGSALPALVNGYPQVTANTVDLSGQANAIKTRTVLVNGVAAVWTAGPTAVAPTTTQTMANWTATVIGLRPGINRILIQSLDQNGVEFERTYQDIWYDDATMTNVSGILAAGTTTWTAAAGPYHITANVTVNAGSTLVIQPGTTVFFDAGTQLLISGGTLTANGTDLARIRFTRTPAAASNFGGIRFTATNNNNSISYADESFSNGPNIYADGSKLTIDHVTWLNTTAAILDFHNAMNFRVTNSILPSVGALEPVHYAGTPAASAELLFQGNIFGGNSGFNDEIDFTGGQRSGAGPYAILQLIDNVFMGPYTDDILDLDGTDAHIEGNVFMNAHLAVPSNPDTSSAISGGQDSGHTSKWTVVRNFFYDLDHANLTKEGNFVTFVNNTVANIRVAAINFDEPLRAGIVPGAGAYVDGNIFYNVPLLFENVNSDGTTTQLRVNRSIVPPNTPVFPGFGTSSLDPSLLNTVGVLDPKAELILRPGPGPAVGTGLNGTDLGADIPGGATIGGIPASPTRQTTATVTVGGPEIIAYKWKLDSGAWSAEIPVTNPYTANPVIPTIPLSGLTNGTHTIFVVRKNSMGIWQADASATFKSWTVNTALPNPPIQINEVLAQNSAVANHSGTFPDMIELYNPGTSAVDLSGMSLTDDPLNPTKYVFPVGTPLLGAGQYLVVYADNPNATGGIHTGFSLKQSGEGVYLYNTPANGGGQLDGVTFGYQLEDLSISRQADGSWRLSNPTFGAAPNFPGALNTALPLGDPHLLKINEWGAHGVAPFSQDFVEVYNTQALPMDIGGLGLTDQPSWTNKSVIPALSFIGSQGHFHFKADNDPEQGADHLDFSLSSERGELGLFDAAGKEIDRIVYGTQQLGLSQGRSPDGGPLWQFFSPPNPGVANPAPPPIPTISVPLINLNDTWRYNQANIDLGTAWRATGYNDTGSGDPGWNSGGAVFGFDADPTVTPIVTPLTLGPQPVVPTYYFRIHFNLAANPSTVQSLQLETVLDDGAILYLNGNRVWSLGVPTGTVTHSTYTGTTNGGRNVNNAVFEGPFPITGADLSSLVQGDNVIAVEVHQTSGTSGDVMWGARLNAILQGVVITPPPLRITEINYHPPGGGTTFSPNDYEFIELKNIGATSMNLTGIHFDAGITFNFASGSLAAGATGVLVKNPTAFANRYGSGINILGSYTDSLDDNGEELRLVAADGNTIQDFAYSDSWYPSTDGDGNTLTIIDPNFDPTAWISPDSWRASKFAFGSPGTTTENAQAVDSVVVNEIQINTTPGGDWIELYNPTVSPINIGGWYLTDSAENLLKYRIPATTIQPGQYISFDESQFNTASPIPFTLNPYGADVWLSSSTTAGILTGYHQGVVVGPAENDVTFGRYTTSTGAVDFPPLATPTRNAANSAPRNGPIVMNEVMYHPATSLGEFIELRNVSGGAVTLDNWKFLDGLEFVFPGGTSLGAGQLLLLVDQDPSIFRSTYNVPASVQVFQYVGALANDGENLVLGKPGPADSGTGFIPYYIVDRVNYGTTPPWPNTPDGQGPSLARIDALAYGNDPINWQASALTGGTPGKANSGSPDAVLDGSAGDDTYYIRRNGANLEVFAGTGPTGSPAFTYPADSASFTFNGNAGNDRLLVDFTNGAPLISGNIVYAGGAQTTSDTLTVIGGAGANNAGSYTPAAGVAGSGAISVGGHGISFTGLEPVLVQSFANFTMTTPASNDSLTLDAPVGGQTRISGSSGGTAFESIAFTSVTNFILDAGLNDAATPNDTVTINNGTSATGLASLQIKLGLGANTINHFGGTSLLNISTTGAGTSTVNVSNASTMIFTASQRLTTLNVNNTATARLASGGGKFIRVTNFTVAATAALDLTDNDLIINTNGGNRDTVYATIFGYLFTGRAGGAWNGKRINSSTAAADPNRNTGLGAIINDTGDGLTPVHATFDGETVDVNAILVKYTWNGDANVDGVVNADDYALLDGGYAGDETGYYSGDFNFSGGSPNSDDYFLIDKSFSGQTGPLGTPDVAPQPAAPATVVSDPASASADATPTASVDSVLIPAASESESTRKTRRHRHHRTRDRDREFAAEKKSPDRWLMPGAFSRR